MRQHDYGSMALDARYAIAQMNIVGHMLDALKPYPDGGDDLPPSRCYVDTVVMHAREAGHAWNQFCNAVDEGRYV